MSEGWLVTVVGTGERREDDLLHWRESLNEAANDTLSDGGPRTTVTWAAYLVQEPGLMFTGVRLEVRTVQGDLTFESPAGTLKVDVSDNLFQVWARPHYSALIRVEGRHECYSWISDGLPAVALRLRRIAALLTVAWDTPWIVRDGPTDRPGATWMGAAGPVSGSSYEWVDDTDVGVSLTVPAALPAWLAECDSRIAAASTRRARAVGRAILMHHEAMLLQRRHPSVALLAFVAAIETLAPGQLPRCASCSARTGSGERFRNLVDSVLPPDEASALADAYERRSRTVHDSFLYGSELMDGGRHFSIFVPDDALVFELSLVRSAQRASRAMIWSTLGLPEQPPTAP